MAVAPARPPGEALQARGVLVEARGLCRRSQEERYEKSVCVIPSLAAVSLVPRWEGSGDEANQQFIQC